jgi:hypothetical protein
MRNYSGQFCHMFRPQRGPGGFGAEIYLARGQPVRDPVSHHPGRTMSYSAAAAVYRAWENGTTRRLVRRRRPSR